MRAAAIVLLCCGSAAADPMPMSAGDVPAPSSSTEIALAREELTIELTRKAAEVTAVLFLENRGAATSLPVGFPCDAGEDPGMLGLDCKTRIAVRVDGKKVAAKKKGAHWVWPMRFTEGQKVKLEVSYASRLRNDRYENAFMGMGTLYYRLATGARWAGPIGELSMRVHLPTDAIAHITPPGYRREHGAVIWELAAHEPDQDVALLFHPMYFGRAAWALPANTRAEMLQKIQKGDFKRDKLLAAAREHRERIDEIVRFAEFFQDVARKKLGLPAPTAAEVRATVEESVKLMEAAAAANTSSP
jgi:hypothetical protein